MNTPSWTARPARLVDVTHIVRLAELTERDGDIGEPEAQLRDASGALITERFDSSKTSSTARLFLSHGALEHGKVFVVEDDQGIAGASVWLPSDVQNPVGVMTEFAQLLEREVGLPEVTLPALSEGVQFADTTYDLLASIQTAQAEWLLVAIITRPELLRDLNLSAALVTPMFELEAPLAALVMRPVVAQTLAKVGFTPKAQATISPRPPHELEISLLVRL